MLVTVIVIVIVIGVRYQTPRVVSWKFGLVCNDSLDTGTVPAQ